VGRHLTPVTKEDKMEQAEEAEDCALSLKTCKAYFSLARSMAGKNLTLNPNTYYLLPFFYGRRNETM